MGKWGNVKQKPLRQIQAFSHIFQHIQTYSDVIRHIQTHSGIIQAYSEPSVTLSYSGLWYIYNPGTFKTRGIFRTLVYPKPWHIQNQRHIQKPGPFRTLEYSEPEAQNPAKQLQCECFNKQLAAIINFASYNCFCNISFSCPVVHKINRIF